MRSDMKIAVEVCLKCLTTADLQKVQAAEDELRVVKKLTSDQQD